MKVLSILLIVGVVVVAGAIIFSLSVREPSPLPPQPQEEPLAEEEPSPPAAVSPESQSPPAPPEELPPPAAPPEPEPPAEEPLPDIPLTEPAAIYGPAAGPNLRVFSVKMSAQGFEPSSIVVNQGDIVQFKFKAVDVVYDISIPYFDYLEDVLESQEKSVSFNVPQSGRFPFSCKEKCPPDKKIQGELIVLPR